MTRRLLLSLLLLGAMISANAAQPIAPPTGLRLAAIFTDNMVLQRDIAIPVWGWADAGEKVTVTIGDQKAEATAGPDGRWTVKLAPLAVGGPVEMTVAGKTTLKRSNILVGDVWVCSGQSNMGMTVKGSLNSEQEIASAKFPKIRLYTVDRLPSDKALIDTKGQWVECSPESVGGFSAAGYFFGREIHKALDVPVGLINTSWGGTIIEAWISPATMAKDPDNQYLTEKDQKGAEAYPKALENWQQNKEKLTAKWKDDVEKAKAACKQAPRAPQAPQDPAKNPNRVAVLYNGMVAPIVPFAVRGAIWYQGESNAGRSYQYRRLMTSLVTDWRTQWNQGEFPFFWVQLPNFMARAAEPGNSGWAELREAQAMALSLPKTGMAVTIDVGEADNIHPKNKQEVGRRLALSALTVAYGKPGERSGPLFDTIKIDGEKARIKFKQLGGGLVVKGEKLTGFAIAGEDKKFVWADASLDGDSVVVSSKTVAKPVAVRYAWADNPDCNLFNKEGVPASPFRTDDWPGVTLDKK